MPRKKVSNQVNPFLTDFTVKVLRKTTIQRDIDGELDSPRILGQQTFYSEVEVDEFTKIYHIGKFAGLLKELSPMGSKLFLFILFSMKQDEDWVKLKQVNLQKDLNVSESSVMNGLKNLIDNGVISKRSTQSEYWINPQIFFAGDRKAYAKRVDPSKISIFEDKKPLLVDVVKTPSDPSKIYRTL